MDLPPFLAFKSQITSIMQKWKINHFKDFQTSYGYVLVGHVFGLRVVALLITTVASIVLARVLGPEQRGVLAAAVVVPTVLASFMNFGYPISCVYMLRHEENKCALVSNGIVFLFAVALITLTAVFFLRDLLFYNVFEGLGSNCDIFLVMLMFPLFLFNMLGRQISRGLGFFRTSSAGRIFESIARTFIILVFCLGGALNLTEAISAFLVGTLVNCVLFWSCIFRSIRSFKCKCDFGLFKKSMSYGLREHLGFALSALNTDLDLFILAFFMDKHSIGIYSVALGIGAFFNFLPAAITHVLFPKLSEQIPVKRKRRLVNKCLKYNGLALFGFWVLYLSFGNWLVPLVYGDNYSASYFIGLILIVGIIMQSSVVIISKFFSGIGRPEIKSIIRLLVLPVKILLLWAFCRSFGILGAALAYTLSNFIGLILFIITYIIFEKDNCHILEVGRNFNG